MLSEVVRPEELLGLVAFSEFVNMVEVFCSDIPLGWIRELVTTVSTDVCVVA